MSLLLSALLLQVAPPTTASANQSPSVKQFYDGEDWSVIGSDDSCLASAAYEKNGTELDIFWYARKKTTVVGIHDNRFASLKQGQDLSLKLYFVKGTKFDDGWGEVSASGDIDSHGKPGFLFRLTGDEALTDFASSSILALLKDKDLVESLKLQNSSKAVAALRRCGDAVLARHPIDPFEK